MFRERGSLHTKGGRRAIGQLKSGKAAGEDEIRPEMLKALNSVHKLQRNIRISLLVCQEKCTPNALKGNAVK